LLAFPMRVDSHDGDFSKLILSHANLIPYREVRVASEHQRNDLSVSNAIPKIEVVLGWNLTAELQ
jgi:hypothetical protein